MKVIVTGVGGFVGSAVAEKLSKNHKVYGIYRKRKPNIKESKNLKFIKSNLKTLDGLPTRCDYIFHAASETPNNSKSNDQIMKSNLTSMKNLIDYSIYSKCKFFLFCSSMSVYGINNQQFISEKSKFIKPNQYGLSKIRCEKLLHDFCLKDSNLKGLSIRFPGIVGKNSEKNFLSNVLKKILKNQQISVYNKNSAFNNIIHVDDIASFANYWFLKKNRSYNMFNVASNRPMSLNSIVKFMMKEVNKKVCIKSNFEGKKPFIIKTEYAKKCNFKIRSTRSSLLKFVTDKKNFMKII